MKAASPNLLARCLRDYFADHLPRIRGMSPHTIQSYRDSLVLLLRFVASDRKIEVCDLDMDNLDPSRILGFLGYLEKERENSITTRNVRLAAIHAFFRYVGAHHPDSVRVVSLYELVGGCHHRQLVLCVTILLRFNSRYLMISNKLEHTHTFHSFYNVKCEIIVF